MAWVSMLNCSLVPGCGQFRAWKVWPWGYLQPPKRYGNMTLNQWTFSLTERGDGNIHFVETKANTTEGWGKPDYLHNFITKSHPRVNAECQDHGWSEKPINLHKIGPTLLLLVGIPHLFAIQRLRSGQLFFFCPSMIHQAVYCWLFVGSSFGDIKTIPR